MRYTKLTSQDRIKLSEDRLLHLESLHYQSVILLSEARDDEEAAGLSAAIADLERRLEVVYQMLADAKSGSPWADKSNQPMLRDVSKIEEVTEL